MQMVQLMHAPVQNQLDTEGSTCPLVVQPMNDIHINVNLPALDFVLSYMTTRFDDNVLPVVRQMMTCSGGNYLLSKRVVKLNDVDLFCNRYNFDVELVVRELNCFIPLFFDNHAMVSMNDVRHQIKIGDRMSDSTMNSDDASCTMWISHTFLQPYRLLHQLSSFPTLFAIYKVQ